MTLSLHWWVALAAVAVSTVYHFSALPALSGLTFPVLSTNKDNCVLLREVGLDNCEDAVRVGNVIYASCDPARTKINKVLQADATLPGETIPNGDIWQIHYTESPPRAVKMNVDVPDFHPLGVATDGQYFLAVNLRLQGATSIDVFELDATRTKLKLKKSIVHPLLHAPNSLHLLHDLAYRDEDGLPSFLVSIDHYASSKLLLMVETYGLMPWASVMFYDARTGHVSKVLGGLAFANGLDGNDSVLFVAETNRMSVSKYDMTLNSSGVHLTLADQQTFDMVTDNVHYDASTDQVVVAGHPRGLETMNYILAADKTKRSKPPSRVDAWQPSTHQTRLLFSDDGSTFSTTTTGILDPTHQKLVIGGLYEQGIMICDQ